MKKIAHILAGLVISFSLNAQDLDTFFNDANAFFKANVANGKVAYQKIKAQPEQLNAIVNMAKGISVNKSNEKAYQAFWINTYNLLVIKSLVDKYPIKSPLDHAGFFDTVKHTVGGKTLTLNAIENNLLRANFKDPRFHFVLVCGAVGCPPLISNAYFPKTLDAQLDAQTKKAINGDFIRVNEKKNRVEVSQIMEWYNEDFKADGLDEIDFINKYKNEKLEGKWKLSYFPYDWAINKQ